MRSTRRCLTGFLILLVATSAAWAQRFRKPPQIGYVWPAGGRQGETFEVTIGGQYLAKATEVIVSGDGVEMALVEHIGPPTQKELANIREIFQRARKKLQANAKAGKRGGRLAMLREFAKIARAEGVTDKQIEAFNRYRKQRNDPKRQLNPQLAEGYKVKVTLAADARPGTRELRVSSPLGLSNPIRFRVGQLPECRESEPNNTQPAATRVTSMPAVLNGQIMPGDVDHFRFRARKGQHLVAKVVARDLIPYLADSVPGWFQATVALYDADGREVAYVDDFRFDPDPVLLYKVPRDGDYVLEIRDSIYRGREDFVYRVELGELPFVSSIFPMGARRGEQVTVKLTGQNLPRTTLTRDLSDAGTGLQSLFVNARPCPSNAVPFAVDDLPEVLEEEPNNTIARARRVSLPVIVNGRIDAPGDWDVFRFRAVKGSTVVAEVHARRLGSPLDSLVKLTDVRGKVLALNDDCVDKGAGMVTHHADSRLSINIRSTGDYLLWLGDTQRKGGPAYGYRLRVSHPKADFALRIVPSAVNAAGGTTVPITMHALRADGFDGDITLRLKDAPTGFKLSGGWVPAGQGSCTLTLSVPAKTTDKVTHLHIEGVATVNGREIRREAVPADDVVQAFVIHHLVPAADWTVVVASRRWGGPGWTIDGKTPVKLRAGGTKRVRVRTRFRRGAARFQLELSNPPEGVTLQKVTPFGGSLAVTLGIDADKVKPGLKGNLILNAFVERKVQPKDKKLPPKTVRVSVGTLPAVPFEVIAP